MFVDKSKKKFFFYGSEPELYHFVWSCGRTVKVVFPLESSEQYTLVSFICIWILLGKVIGKEYFSMYYKKTIYFFTRLE